MKKQEPKFEREDDRFSVALSKIAKADAASSRAAIEAAKATKPSRHTRFVYDPARGRA
jgi:hypothetical protein